MQTIKGTGNTTISFEVVKNKPKDTKKETKK
jgi:hypothetical protein